MSVFYPINISTYCNHKLIYSKAPKLNEVNSEIGLDNIYIFRGFLKSNDSKELDGVDFKLSHGKYDNIICDRQRIKIGRTATKLHVLGFAYWGDTNEYFKVIYADHSEKLVKIPFIDWSHPWTCKQGDINWYGENIKTVMIVPSAGAQFHAIYFHHSFVELDETKEINQIVLPDNMLTHIFALTLETADNN